MKIPIFLATSVIHNKLLIINLKESYGIGSRSDPFFSWAVTIGLVILFIYMAYRNNKDENSN